MKGFKESDMERGESRRRFLEKLGASALGGGILSQMLAPRAMGGPGGSPGRAAPLWNVPQNTVPWTAPPALVNPNILVIMVDQMRYPLGLSSLWVART